MLAYRITLQSDATTMNNKQYSADDLCPVCHKLRNKQGICDCYKSWGNTFKNTAPVSDVKWQLCPLCNGQGTISKPAYVPGDVYEWLSTSAVHVCHICNGATKK